MKILVTGAAGFLGSAFLKRLLIRGCEDIRCIVRSTSRAAHLCELAAGFPQSRVELMAGNLVSRQDACDAARDVDLVFHLAASMRGAPADMFLNTVVASRNLLDAFAGRPSTRFVLVSSFSVYGTAQLGRGALVNEDTPLEPHPERRDVYAQAKLRQEYLFREYQERAGFELVILRPGVIFGPGGAAFSGRVGLNLFGIFLHLGGGNLLPLTYVDNCAEAIAVAGFHPGAAGQVYNVVDDELLTSREYLRLYKKQVGPLRSLRVPYFALQWMSRAVESYHRRSRGQLPAVFTPYKTSTMWGGNRFENKALRAIGWRPVVSTREGLHRTFESLAAAKRTL